MRRALRTPTFLFSSAGLALAGLYLAGQGWAATPAIVLLAVPGVGGVAIAVYEEVERRGEEWAWRGIVRAFSRRPSRPFLVGVLTHLPQALLALWLLLRGRRGR